ncbi:MAG: hypothetical protein PHQ23_14775, partial [Candidatus Wallbacteria bacterium]|nr:hypothetical protein [Candidatus Wallbacteria bacterium]
EREGGDGEQSWAAPPLSFRNFIRYISEQTGVGAVEPFEFYEKVSCIEKDRLLACGEYLLIDEGERMGKKQFDFLKNWLRFYGNAVICLNTFQASALPVWLEQEKLSYGVMELPFSHTVAPNVAEFYRSVTGREIRTLRKKKLIVDFRIFQDKGKWDNFFNDAPGMQCSVLSEEVFLMTGRDSGRICRADLTRVWSAEEVALVGSGEDFSEDCWQKMEFWVPFFAAGKKITICCFPDSTGKIGPFFALMEAGFERKHH